ncbi:MAG: hypothetical protein BZ138_03740 [Methanosphaera sp. rholeuAM270]|nr:MAG: hypothetical protein BZ138_03740 [Methanosphaera sp. rholeuAM270]
MKSKIIEVFSSIQGEGLLIGRRQIFIRFAGCNIDCKYCDTQESKTMDIGKYYSFEELDEKIQSLLTPDVHSLEITGGEPLLHSDYIRKFLSLYDYRVMLETNATLPNNLEDLSEVIDIVSMDIKLPEHFNTREEWLHVYENELKSIEILETHDIEYYIKIVVSSTTTAKIIEDILKDLVPIVSSNVELIIQPVSPMTLWPNKNNLFTISEIIGNYFNVSIIPQIHKYMEIE